MDLTAASLRAQFQVPFEFPVHFGHGLLQPHNPLLARTADRLGERRRHRLLAVVDAGLLGPFPKLPATLARYAEAHAGELDLVAAPLVVAGGEPCKQGWAEVQRLTAAMLHHRLCRQSLVLAVGGGALLDVAGLAAALVHRGLRLLRMPTTVLAQADSGVGVKNAINLGAGKNLLGAFAPPFAVLNDFDFLPALPDAEWCGGIAEAFKVALIRDAAFFAWLIQQAPALRARDLGAMETLIRRCAQLHVQHIVSGGDPFETGRARPLDFGHWAAHKLEALSGYRRGHGQAVAIGVALDAHYAQQQGWLSAGECEAVWSGLEASGLPLWCEELEQRGPDGRPALWQGVEDFREHLGGTLCVTFPRGIGARQEVDHLDPAGVEAAIAALRRRATTPGPESGAPAQNTSAAR